MDEKKKDSFSLKEFICETSGFLLGAFLSGVLIFDIMRHLTVDGIRPGAGLRGDITDMLSPFFVVISTAILACSITEEFNSWKAIAFHLLYELGILLSYYLISVVGALLIGSDYFTNALWWVDILSIIIVYFVVSAMSYAIFRVIWRVTAGRTNIYTIVVIVVAIIGYIPLLMILRVF